ncbi:sulfite reductase subunit C [Clostridium paraputrificum]|uniref:Sulfite reductase subunit C n=1 Tax=Clostridium paraputrificum TaxID=29363 RepID=A0A1B8RMB9_9CLOT|nr:sulfite reductase subunit C [Clostridium paraputrificum]OBY10005.1 sulfite reductase subunit C [Clostridium paraputrificum]
MNHDIDIKKVRLNCFRQSKVPGEFMLQMRVPGGLVNAKYLSDIQYIAETYGNGTFHMGMRQTFSIPGIKYENIPSVNEYISNYLKEVEVDECNCNMTVDENGYPTIGARNVMACIGNSHCIKANANTKDLANKIESLVFPSHYHIKVSVSGCPNDCAKAHFQDFGVIGQSRMIYHPERCIGCGACVKACEHHATRVLSLNKNGLVDKDPCCCVGCGECVLACPASAWTRSPQKFYRVVIGGRTGKQTPRMGKTFLNFVTEDVVLGMFANWQKFSAWALDYKPEYLHGGHLIDRAGYHRFKEIILDGVELNPEALVAENIYWAETEYRSNINVKPIGKHKTIESNREVQD